jgi:hypothetical protein
MNYETKRNIIGYATEELKPFLFKQSVAFIVTGDNGNVTLASGTLVSIGERLFIATASHAIPKITPGETYTFLSEQYDAEILQAPVLNTGNRTDNRPDVGYLELATNTALEYLKEIACPLKGLAIRGVGRPLRPTILIGNPSEYVKRKEGQEGGTSGLVPNMLGYFAIPLMESEWPSDVESDPAIHIFLEYPNTPANQFGSDESIMLPDPAGMSGGGLWDYGFEDAAVWTKESAKLIGIQSGWYDDLRYTVAVQHFPELLTNNGDQAIAAVPMRIRRK